MSFFASSYSNAGDKLAVIVADSDYDEHVDAVIRRIQRRKQRFNARQQQESMETGLVKQPSGYVPVRPLA
jgi:hypothetical protein